MQPWSEGDVKANGITIHYHRTGGDGKPAILLLHGLTDNGLCWSVVARDLEDDYDVIMPDARGHGRSSRIAGQFSIELLGDDAAALIGALGLEKPFVFGHSMGAVTAIALAAKYPDLVRAVVLEDPPLIDAPLPVPEPAEGEEETPATPDFHGMTREERIATARAMQPNWSDEENIPWADSRVEFDQDVLNHLSTFEYNRWREALARIRCPVLLLTGDPAAQAIVTPERAKEAAGIMAQGQVAQIEGAGHCIHRDKHDEAMRVVEDFLRLH